MTDERIALANEIEARHWRASLETGTGDYCDVCRDTNGDVAAWPCDAIKAARLLRESAQREAALSSEIEECIRRTPRSLSDAFKRGVEAARLIEGVLPCALSRDEARVMIDAIAAYDAAAKEPK